MKKIIRKSEKYMAVFEPDKNGGFTVVTPSLPGCISEDDTFEETSKNIAETAEWYVEVTHA
ncbi:MAG: type II toxin-antitoxin system HicB family antitoxin [Candidatus Paceibacterota bacterium]|jgi:predicted RNase H-like HicB family nuclease